MQGQVDISYQPFKVKSSRPFEIQRLFLNRTPEQVVQFIGLAYSLCGKAQKFAAKLALNELLTTEEKHKLNREVRVETLKEHYINISKTLFTENILTQEQYSKSLQGAGNWVNHFAKNDIENNQQTIIQTIKDTFELLIPGLTDLTKLNIKHKKTLLKLNAICPSIILINNKVKFNENPLNNSKALQKNIEESMLDTSTWLKWVETPELNGSSVENSIYSKVTLMGVNLNGLTTDPLQQRFISKLIDVIMQIQVLENSPNAESETVFFQKTQQNISVSWVETARGRLYHMAEINLKTGKVENYAISAPTEWNFHPKGIAQQLILDLPKLDFESWKNQVYKIAQIIDPCVPINITQGNSNA